MTSLDIGRLRAVLRDIDFPATRDDLLREARRSAGDDATVRTLHDLPDRSFNGSSAVIAALSGSRQSFPVV
ncbi:DUF2795 domain-containing protein [Salinibacterium sp. ZJ454]|uniref:DUF2795 domain-containing protein n=1 Tax=Salinibacterium sp. ZJ454 TaxID=2708339 RepID=UPI001421D852|nr:DUF2795 domain-containing protein [Salinibacterium sp. ZJ454]